MAKSAMQKRVKLPKRWDTTMPDTPLNPDALTQRDIMAGQIGAWIDEWDDGKADTGHVATHIANRLAESGVATLAATQPEVNSVEELDALPIQSIVLDSDDDDPLQLVDDGEGGSYWVRFGDTGFYSTADIILPATVLYIPEVKP